MLNYELIGRRIKETRKLHKISQSELAERTDLSTSYVSCIENAKKKASLNALVHISNAMGITVDSLLSGNQNSDSKEYQNDIWILIQDCSSFEKKIIFEIILALKSSLRDNKCLFTMNEVII